MLTYLSDFAIQSSISSIRLLGETSLISWMQYTVQGQARIQQWIPMHVHLQIVIHRRIGYSDL